MSGLILEIVEGAEAGRVLEVGNGIELGRDPSLPETINDEQVSRKHARLTPAGDGVRVEDVGSSNGTYVNDQPIAGGVQMAPGDRVRIGLTVLELRSPEQVRNQKTVVGAVPQLTEIGANVLQPAAEEDLAPVAASQLDPDARGFLSEETEPAFIQSHAIEGGGDGGGGGDEGGGPAAIARLVDTRVKRQTNVAAIALPLIALVAVVLVLGIVR